MSEICYYCVRLIGEMVYYVDQHTGDTIKEKLMELKAGDAFRHEFIEFEDVSGSDVCIQALEVESIYLSTPRTRAADKEGMLSEIQAIIDEQKRWESD